jgi:hypothetical protein
VVNAADNPSSRSFLLYSIRAVSAVDKMALSNLGRRMTLTSAETATVDEKELARYAPPDGDIENQAPGSRRMSRIDKPADVAETDSTVSVGAQIEMEKENAIKYRTCSWQKVSILH